MRWPPLQNREFPPMCYRATNIADYDVARWMLWDEIAVKPTSSPGLTLPLPGPTRGSKG